MVHLVVMTGDIPFYYEITKILARQGYRFTSLLPSDELISIPLLVMTTESEIDLVLELHPSLLPKKIIVFQPPYSTLSIEPRLTRRIIQLQAGKWQKLIIGIDPGSVFGVVALINNMIVQRQQAHSPKQAAQDVQEILTQLGAQENILRIGKGAPVMTQFFLKALLPALSESLKIEMVDEFGTNRAKLSVQDGFKFVDLAAAAKIARTSGTPREGIGKLRQPTRGEIRWVQQLSRKQTRGQVTISEIFAKQVLQGELSLEEAIKEFRSPLNT